MSNELAIRDYLNSGLVQDNLSKTLGRNAQSFVTSALSAVNGNYQLKNASPQSVYAALMKAATLNLAVDPNLGFAYLVPYGGEAQLQLGYKGLAQLALRSGQVTSINTGTIYEGEFESYNKITGELKLKEDGDESGDVVGYFAYIKLANGGELMEFQKKSKVLAFAKKKSKTFKNGPWQTDFDAMAEKTVLKSILKFAPMSLEMQEAISIDEDEKNYKAPKDAEVVDESFGLEEVPDEAETKEAESVNKSAVTIEHEPEVEDIEFDLDMSEVVSHD